MYTAPAKAGSHHEAKPRCILRSAPLPEDAEEDVADVSQLRVVRTAAIEGALKQGASRYRHQ